MTRSSEKVESILLCERGADVRRSDRRTWRPIGRLRPARGGAGS
jgi:hypothetical protein